jgi:hypothetical protein
VKREEELEHLMAEKAKRNFCSQFKRHLANSRKARVSLPTAFTIVWNYMSQTVRLPEKDSREVYEELITWVSNRQWRFDQEEPCTEMKFREAGMNGR